MRQRGNRSPDGPPKLVGRDLKIGVRIHHSRTYQLSPRVRASTISPPCCSAARPGVRWRNSTFATRAAERLITNAPSIPAPVISDAERKRSRSVSGPSASSAKQ